MATYKPIQTVTLTTAASDITFSGIDQTYTDLVLTYNGNISANQYIGIRFNGNSSSYYSQTRLYGDGSTLTTDIQTSASFGRLSVGDPSNLSSIIVSLNNYSNTTTYKTWLSRSNIPSSYVGLISGTWRGSTGSSTEAITSITLTTTTSDTFAAGSVFSLYGISPVNAKVSSASGGTDIFYDSTYVYHVFKGTGAFVPTRALTADVLVVAGGGGSGRATGGGGAGGIRYLASQALTSGTTYTVTVGAGGGGQNDVNGLKGTDSVFGALVTAYGGGAGSRLGGTISNGGSSGGVAVGQTPGTASSGTGGIGYANIGAAGGATYGGYGGGGGAAAVGNENTGGNGTSAFSSWGTATGTGENVGGTYYYAGGGGGARNSPTPSAAQAGGYGGGGASGDRASGTATAGSSAKTNTGGGAGGGGIGASDGTGANGGSGIIIVRYAR